MASDAAVPARTARAYFGVLSDTLIEEVIAEVDFLTGDEIAIEVKSTANPTDRRLAGLRPIGEKGECTHRILMFDGEAEAAPRVVDGIQIMLVGLFLHRLWDNEYRYMARYFPYADALLGVAGQA